MRPTLETDKMREKWIANARTRRGHETMEQAISATVLLIDELAEHSEKLERQRDEAVDLLRNVIAMLDTSDGYGVRCPPAVNGRAWLFRAYAFLARLEKEKSC